MDRCSVCHTVGYLAFRNQDAKCIPNKTMKLVIFQTVTYLPAKLDFQSVRMFDWLVIS